MNNQELRAHHKIVHREEALFARTKRKLEKRIRKIDDVTELMNQHIDTSPILSMLNLEKTDRHGRNLEA